MTSQLHLFFWLLALLGACDAFAESEGRVGIHVNADESIARPLRAALDAEGFPAISTDGREVAVFYSADDAQSSTTVSIFSTVKKVKIKDIAILSEAEGNTRSSDETRKEAEKKADTANNYLIKGKFLPIKSLYSIKLSDNLNDEFVNTEKHVKFDQKTGKLTIESPDAGKPAFEFIRPRRSLRSPDGLHSTTSQGLPLAGWFDERTRTLVLRIETMTSDESYHPDEWVVQRLP